VKKKVQKCEIEWLEGMMGVGNTNTKCCGGGQLTCVHHVVFVSDVSGKRR
jgi:hypothetical protein